MARLEDLPKVEAETLRSLACPTFSSIPCVSGPPLNERRVAIVSTAGLHRKGDRPFTLNPGDSYRIIPGDIQSDDLVLSHVSTNFDRSGFQMDWNVVFPIDRLHDLQKQSIIGSVASFHYSFMGAHEPESMKDKAKEIADFLKADRVDAAILIPV